MGLSLLCALAFTASSAAIALAATSGTTAVTCVSKESGGYGDAHCDTTGGANNFGHKPLTANPTSNVISTNAATKNSTTEATKPVLEATVGGIATKLEATTLAGSGSLENVPEGEVHKIKGGGITITYTGVTVVNPANCKVHSPGQAAGTVKTNALKSESVEGTPMTQKFMPEAGGEKPPFVTLEFENNGGTCSINGLAPTVTGTVSAEPSGQMTNGESLNSTGATMILNVTKASAQLKVGGQNASLTATETVKMEGGNPIAAIGPPFCEEGEVGVCSEQPFTLEGMATEIPSITPKPIVFHANGNKLVGFYVPGPTNAGETEETTVDGVEVEGDSAPGAPHFVPSESCNSKTFMARFGYETPCIFGVLARNFNAGVEATLVVKYHAGEGSPVPAYAPLKME